MQQELLAEAIDALAQNDRVAARTVLGIYTKHYPQDPDGWLWSSRASEHPAQKIEFLKRVLELDPGNRVALSSLLIASRTRRPTHPATESETRAPVAPSPEDKPARRAGLNLARSLGSWSFFLAASIVLALVAIVTVPMFVGYRSLVVLSGSMEPAIAKGGVVLAAPVPSRELERGDVIVFAPTADAQVPLIHRIVKIREKDGVRQLITRGDANRTADAAEISLPPTAWRVVFSLPVLGYIIGWATQPLGTLTLIIIPLLGLAGLKLADVFKKLRPAFFMPAPRNV